MKTRPLWQTASVADILTVRNGYAVKSSDYSQEGVPLIRQSDINGDIIDVSEAKRVPARVMEECSGYLVREGDLLIGMSGSLGKIGRYTGSEPAIQNQRTGLLLLKPGFSSGFAKLVLKFVEQQIVAEGKGVAVQNVSAKEIEACTFPLPPEEERDQIVAETEKQFTRLEAGVVALRRAQANLKRYRAALLKAACEGRLVPTEAELAQAENRKFEAGEELLARILTERREKWNGKGKYKEAAGPDTTTLPQLAEGWTWATLDQLCPRFVDSAHRTPKYGPAGVPALGPRDVVGGRLNLQDARRVNEQEFKVQTARHIPEAGDIVYSRELSLGWGAVVPEGERLCLSQGMCLFRPHRDVNRRFFLAGLNGPVGRTHAEAAATGSAHPHLNLGDIKKYAFPLPPIAEQDRIVVELERRLSVIEELETVTLTELQRANRLRQSILQETFNGS